MILIAHGDILCADADVVNQEMIAAAALEGDRDLALQAMVNDPLVHDLEKGRAMLEELVVAHEAYLRQFRRRVAVAA